MLRRLLADRSGATAIEYGLIAALIAAVLIASLTALGTDLGNALGDVAFRIIAANRGI
jgi:pilus assembly protein Flp/PilA